MDGSLAIALIAGLALILSVSVYSFAQLRIERERTLQRLIDRGMSGDELIRAAGLANRGPQDLRRGLFFLGLGLAWSITTFFIGGTAWIMGGIPIAIGLVFLLLKALDGRSR